MGNLSSEALASAIGNIYEAAYDAVQWKAVAEQVHRILNCSRVCIALTEPSSWSAITTVEDDAFLSSECYAAHMRDPYATASIAQTVGDVFQRPQIVNEVEFRQRDLWHDWMKPRDMWQGMTSNLYSYNKELWSIHVHRSETQAEFDDPDVEAMRILVTHMMRAKDIADKIHQAAQFGKLFEQLPIGVLLVDKAGKVEFCNDEAQRLLSGSASIGIRSGRIFCDSLEANTRLAALVSSVWSDDMAVARGGTFVAKRHDEGGAAGLVVSVAPFSGPEYYGLPPKQFAMIILRDVFLQASTERDAHMRELFGLTAAEAGLCSLLASGITLQDAAARNKITVKTARTYLERIFAKTATRQQSQLVALIKGTRPLM